MREDRWTRRAAELAETTALPATEIHRRVRAESGIPIGYGRISAVVRRARTRPAGGQARRDPAELADRILSLLDAEIARLEAASGKVDLERLERVARTVRSVEPIRPQSQRKRASLRSVLPEEQDRRLEEYKPGGKLADLNPGG